MSDDDKLEDKLIVFPGCRRTDAAPEIGVVEGLDLGGCDADEALNMRAWLEKALEAAGAKVTDAGMGMGGADVGINLDGAAFSVRIKPRLKE